MSGNDQKEAELLSLDIFEDVLADLRVVSAVIGDLEHQISELEAENASLRAKISELEAENEQLQRRITDYDDMNNRQAERIRNLRAKLPTPDGSAPVEENAAFSRVRDARLHRWTIVPAPLELPTDQEAWDKAAPFIARAMARHYHILYGTVFHAHD